MNAQTSMATNPQGLGESFIQSQYPGNDHLQMKS